MSDTEQPRVSFRDGGMEAAHPDSGKNLRKVVIISYAEGRNHSVYFEMSKREAMERFERKMQERSPYEAEQEGWEASVWMGTVTDELHIHGNFGDQVSDLVSKLQSGMFRDD